MSENPRVLLVDYDPKNVQALTDLFRSSGYRVETVSDGLAAITSFKELKPDIVLIEAMIPKKHGFEVCQEIKKTPRGKTTPVILMTAVYKGRKYRTQAMNVHGCDEYVEKPCPPETILALVSRFVPPGKSVPQPVSVTAETVLEAAAPERCGDVIPFPVERSNRYQAPIFDDDAEMEIMSRLDEIMPDAARLAAVVEVAQAPVATLLAAPTVETQATVAVAVIEEDPPPAIPVEREPDQPSKKASKGWAVVEAPDPSPVQGEGDADSNPHVVEAPDAVSEEPTTAPEEPAIPLVIVGESHRAARSPMVPALIVSVGIIVLTFFVWYFTL